jgi:uncharacterized membrane protein YfcA
MDLLTVLMLLAAGTVGGALSGLVGGASLVTFPAMLAVGLPPITAVASNTVAALPSNFAAAFVDRTNLPRFDRAFIWFVVASVLGAALGAILLLLTPPRTFEILVPLLLGFATLLFALSKQVARFIRARAEARGRAPAERNPNSIPLMFPVSVYGGYFGAGVGVMALAVLSLNAEGDYRAANMTKNIVMGLNTIVASAVLVVQGAVAWPPTLAMMAGTLIGGFAGGYLARVVPQPVMRVFVTAVGALLTAVFAWRYWL